ncbi:Na+/phosphate symporter [Bradyrhizobium sp. OAE829]
MERDTWLLALSLGWLAVLIIGMGAAAVMLDL